jgi:hypothetical protein
MLVFALAALLIGVDCRVSKIPPTKPSPPTNCSKLCSGKPLPLSTSVPNVLLVSDSIGSGGTGYLTNTVAMLGPSNSSVTGAGTIGNAFVQHSGTNWTALHGYCGTSIGVVACAKPWLAGQQTKFDVIHWNWGLHDIAPSMYYPITTDEYVANMEALYGDLKSALTENGTLIFTTTTPVPPSYKNRNNSDVVKINALAMTLFGPGSKHPEVVVHDLYQQIVQRCSRDSASVGYPETSDCMVIQSNGVHMSPAGRQFTAIVTAASIAPYL